MGCLGVLFALTQEDIDSILDDDGSGVINYADRLSMLQDGIEEDYLSDTGRLLKYTGELDTAWDAIHRVMTDGHFALDNGAFPLSYVIMGGESLYAPDDYYMILKTPDQVKLIWQALQEVTEEWFRERYFKIDAEDYGFDVDESDCLYSWQWFEYSLKVWEIASKENRYMLFTVDQ